MLSLAEERELVDLSREGNEQAYERLIQAFTPALYRVVLRMASDPQEAEATVQEAFWRAWRSLGRYQSDRPFFPYLVTVALNIQRDRWRVERRIEDRDLDEAASEVQDPAVAPEVQLEESEMMEVLAKGIQQLPRPYRMVVALRYDAGLSYERIAELLDLPVNTVRTHLRRAKMALRKWMEEYHG